MAHPNNQTFCLEIPVNDPEKMEEFNQLMSEVQDEQVKYEREEAKKLGLPEDSNAIVDICYLRTRSRWTQEKEDCLVKLAKEGKRLPPMMEDFDPAQWLDPNFDVDAYMKERGYTG